MSLKTVLIMVLSLAFLYALFTVGAPFLLAIVIAIFLEPAISLLMAKGRMNRLAASTIICSLFTLVMLGLSYWLGVKVISETIDFMKNAPAYFNEANAYVQQTMERTQLFYNSMPPELAEQAQTWLETMLKTLTDTLNSIVRSISGYFFNIAVKIPNLFIFFTVFFVSIYLFSMNLTRLKTAFLSLFHEQSVEKVEKVLVNLRKAIFGFIFSQAIMSALTYVLVFCGFALLGVSFPLALSLLVVAVDILPVLGVGSVLIPWAIYSYIVGDSYLGTGLVIMFLIILVVRRVVEPKVLGNAVGISALSALVSLYVGYKIVGVVGLFLGPIVVIVYEAMRKVGLLSIKIKLED